MKTVGLVIIGLLAAGALVFWIRTEVGFPHVAIPTAASLVDSSSPSSLAAAAATAHVTGEYVDISGTIIIDTTGGTSVPFLQYIDANNRIATKQLVYANDRACAPNAGDYPCTDVNPNQAYPQYPDGTSVRVRGMHVDDRILVYQIDPL
ncbi:MAG TPA: hypothetical protein VGN56_01440 [Candidatus Paceibacterota bacterium]|jgi:hypothetical protein|nr:hypothetical protein [Candidatus Paceibacterota bacterium]